MECNMEKKQKDIKIEIKLDESIASGDFTNFSNISYSPSFPMQVTHPSIPRFNSPCINPWLPKFILFCFTILLLTVFLFLFLKP